MVDEIRHIRSKAPVIRAILEQIPDRHRCMTESKKTQNHELLGSLLMNKERFQDSLYIMKTPED